MIKLHLCIDNDLSHNFTNIQEYEIPIHHDRLIIQEFLNNNIPLQKQFPNIKLEEHGITWVKYCCQFLMTWHGNLHVTNNTPNHNKSIRIWNPIGNTILKNSTFNNLLIKGNLIIEGDNVSINKLNVIGSIYISHKLTVSYIQSTENIINSGSLLTTQIISNNIENKTQSTIETDEIISETITNNGTICSKNNLSINLSNTFDNHALLLSNNLTTIGIGHIINNGTIKTQNSINISNDKFTNNHLIHSQGTAKLNTEFKNLGSITVINNTIITGTKQITNISSNKQSDLNNLTGFVLSGDLFFSQFTGTFNNEGFISVQGTIYGQINILANNGLFGTNTKFDLTINTLETSIKSNIVGDSRLEIGTGTNNGVITSHNLLIQIKNSFVNSGLLNVETLTIEGEKIILDQNCTTKIKNLITKAKIEIFGKHSLIETNFLSEWIIKPDAEIESKTLYIGWWGENHGTLIINKITNNSLRLTNTNTISTDMWTQATATQAFGTITNTNNASIDIKQADNTTINKLINSGEITIDNGTISIVDMDNTGSFEMKKGLLKLKQYTKMGQIIVDRFLPESSGIYFDKKCQINKFKSCGPFTYLIIGDSTVINNSTIYVHKITNYSDLTFRKCSVYCMELLTKDSWLNKNKVVLDCTKLFVEKLENLGLIKSNILSIASSTLEDSVVPDDDNGIYFCDKQNLLLTFCRVEMEKKSPSNNAMKAIQYYNDIITNPHNQQIYKTAATYELTKLLLTGGKYGLRKTCATPAERNKMIASLELIKQKSTSNSDIHQYITNQINKSPNQSHTEQCKQFITSTQSQTHKQYTQNRQPNINQLNNLGTLETTQINITINDQTNIADILDLTKTWSGSVTITGNEFNSTKDITVNSTIQLNLKKFTNQHNISVGSENIKANLSINTDFFTNDRTDMLKFAQLTVYGSLTIKTKYNLLNLHGKITSLNDINFTANYTENGKFQQISEHYHCQTTGGYISSANNLTITSDSITTSFGKLISNNNIKLTAKHNITNQSGAIISGGDITIQTDKYYQSCGNLTFKRIMTHTTRIRNNKEYTYCINIYELTSQPAQLNAYNGSIYFNINSGHLKGSTIWAVHDIKGHSDRFVFETVSANTWLMLTRNSGQQGQEFIEPDPPSYTHYVAAIQAGKYFEADVGSLILKGSISGQHVNISAGQINSHGLPQTNNRKAAIKCNILQQIHEKGSMPIQSFIGSSVQIPWEIPSYDNQMTKFSIPLNLFRYGVALTLSHYLGTLYIDGKSGDELIEMLCRSGKQQFEQIKKKGIVVTKEHIPTCMQPFLYYEVQRNNCIPQLYLPDGFVAGEHHLEPGSQTGNVIVNHSTKSSEYRGTRIQGKKSVELTSDGLMSFPLGKTYTVSREGDKTVYQESLDGQQANIISQGTIDISAQSINAVSPVIQSQSGTNVIATNGDIQVKDLTLTRVELTTKSQQSGREKRTYRHQSTEESNLSGKIQSQQSNNFTANNGNISITNTPITAGLDNTFEAKSTEIKTVPLKKSTTIETTRTVTPKRFLFWKGGGSYEQYNFHNKQEYVQNPQTIISGRTTRFTGNTAQLTGTTLTSQSIEDYAHNTTIKPTILNSTSQESYYKKNNGVFGFNRKTKTDNTNIETKQVLPSEITTNVFEVGSESESESKSNSDFLELQSVNLQVADKTTIKKSIVQSMEQNTYSESKSSHRSHNGIISMNITPALNLNVNSPQSAIGTASQLINIISNPTNALPTVDFSITNQQTHLTQDTHIKQDIPNTINFGHTVFHNIPRFRVAGYTICKTVEGKINKFESVPIQTSLEHKQSQQITTSSITPTTGQVNYNQYSATQQINNTLNENSTFTITDSGSLNIEDASFIQLTIDASSTDIIIHRNMIEQTIANICREHSEESYIGVNASLDMLSSLNVLGMITNCGFNSVRAARVSATRVNGMQLNCKLRCDGDRELIEPVIVNECLKSDDLLGGIAGNVSQGIAFSTQITSFCNQLNNFMDSTVAFEV